MSDNNTLLAHFQGEVLAIRQFIDLLKAEQDALATDQVEALNVHSQSKLEQVDKLNRLATERMRLMAAAGVVADERGVEQWLAIADPTVRKVWDELLTLAKEAKTNNQLNGKLIQQRMQHHQQALAVLMAAANQVKLYGADGRPQGAYSSAGASRGIIGKA